MIFILKYLIIFVNCSHDYDLDVAGTANTVTCTVTVSDGDLKDTTSLVVTINDVNDNTPTFGSATYTFYTQPHTGVGTVLGSFTATDGDVGAFGKCQFGFLINVININIFKASYFTIQYFKPFTHCLIAIKHSCD